MTDPNDPSGDDSRPTEHFDAQPGYTDDRSRAYGDVGYQPPQPPPYYPPQQGYPQQGYPQQGYPQQGYNPTQAFPAYGQQNYDQVVQQPEPGRSESSKGWIIGLGAAVVIALMAVGVVLALHSRPDESSIAAPSRAPSTTTPRTVDPSRPGATLPRSAPGTAVPTDPFSTGQGFPSVVDGIAIVFGTVQSNDGSTLVIEDFTGAQVTIRTTEKTELTAVGLDAIADLPTGTSVVVQGRSGEDGSVTADSIIGF